jgi:GAF domain-containing protein/membrane protein implicated in regulation of membrane protease activity
MNQTSHSSLPLWQRLTAPHPSIQDVGEKRRASLLASISLVLFPLMALATISGFVFRQSQGMDQIGSTASMGLTITFIITHILARSRYYRVGAGILALIFVVFTVQLAIAETAPLSDVLYSVLPVMFIISIAFFNTRGMWMLFLATMAGMAVIAFFERALDTRLLVQSIGVTASMALLAIIVVRFRDSVERERLSELQSANQELTSIKNELEQRVQERTAGMNIHAMELERYARQMEAVSKVARVIASIQDLNRLLPAIAQVVSEQFGFYHTGIFLLDERGEYAILQAANSEGGQHMLKRGHRLRAGATGIVGTAAGQGEARIALDVGSDAVYFNNPDLPETRSEIALPLKVGSQIVGVLDVQSKEVGAFKEEDIAVLGILADQISVAIENARLFGETKQALAESQDIYQQYVKRDWSHFARNLKNSGYTFDGIKAFPIEKTPPAPPPNALTLSIKVRGLTIGNVIVRSNNPLHTWSQDEINLAQTAADRAGLGIENFRLLTEAQRRASKERTIGEIASRIGTSVDARAIMQTAVEELGRILPGSEIVLQFQEKKSNDN